MFDGLSLFGSLCFLGARFAFSAPDPLCLFGDSLGFFGTRRPLDPPAPVPVPPRRSSSARSAGDDTGADGSSAAAKASRPTAINPLATRLALTRAGQSSLASAFLRAARLALASSLALAVTASRVASLTSACTSSHSNASQSDFTLAGQALPQSTVNGA
jgi:hypothetical protein